ncbi:hypothetical protein MOQ_003483 [Trypanosoma cruzi marinkellei]|uniref:CUE domain-containing protein n=1 Tax=Trypanosoma cruzi marinkellei TaxID=85056 RepID=K2N032_TRYCR|nr:hypothetical protein MOQ_003483 [Trypanosoma cruzi marinkellei]
MLKEKFPDSDAAVCSTFFRTTDASEKTWHDVALVAELDDHTFWTVVANHRNLPLVLRNLITAVDVAHSSAFRRQLKRSDEHALIAFIVRLATTTSAVLSAGVSLTSVARHLEEIIPPDVLMPVSLIILRHCFSIASVTITSLILLNPLYLSAMSATATSWCNATSRLSVQCVREVARGRHQRIAGDVVQLFEQVYRHVKHLWALVHCAPFLADYMPLTRVLQYLRVVVDLISPLLQHFLLTCTTLSKRREQLSKANSVFLNAAVNTASILILFRTYHKVAGDDRCHCVERIVVPVYDALTSHIVQKVRGPPSLLLSNTRRPLTRILHELVPPQAGTDELEVGKLLRHLSEAVPDSKDFSDGFLGARSRYLELLLLELIHQGFHIDVLMEEKFITIHEAEELGASERVITQAILGIVEKTTGDVALPTSDGGNDDVTEFSTSAAAADSSDPLVRIVLDVMPHFNVEGIKAALCYYNNDVEHFIIDASMNNIPPHLLTQLSEPSSSGSVEVSGRNGTGASAVNAIATTVPTSGVTHTLTSNDYDSNFDDMNLDLFISLDLCDVINGDDRPVSGDDLSNDLGYTTYHPDSHRGAAEMFEVDEALREKIRMLTELMYEDEFDDTQEVAGVCGYEAGQDANSSASSASDEEKGDAGHSFNNGLREEGAMTTTTPHRPRTQYDEKRFYETRSKQREKNLKALKEAQEDAPAYTKKKKITRKKMQSKMALTRDVKRGKSDF